ncbi:MAG: transcriptional regulator, NifA subfamily, Fis Family, partial [Labilithrix sp.]|nr:transcriptional regulator, NifA subfamily, Fis Family [Labilithrix sp.]
MRDLELGTAPTARSGRVCVVDDDLSTREAIAGLIRSAGLEVEMFASAREYLDAGPREAPLCLVLDVDMPGISGLHLQERLTAARARVPIIFVSGHADIPMSVRAIKAGAREFFTKPFDPDELLEAIRSCITREPAAGPQASGREHLSKIIGRSAALQDALRQVETVAPTDSTVLIHGETGTGKELIARAIHRLSGRNDGPFVKVNCAAIPSGLLESELMGHERGAFTGAVSRRIGRFELAHDGTIFLDEIGEIPIGLQPKLLRLLQEREFERIGSSTTIQSNARLVAATNRDLRTMVGERTFREDLFYRLNVFPIEVPPLRERPGDVEVLVEHLVRDLTHRLGKDIHRVNAPTMERLVRHDWPGNVRELQNVLERAVILCSGPTLDIPFVGSPASARTPSPSPASAEAGARNADLAAVSREHILRVLEATHWVIGGPDGAAARLGLNRTTLHFRMKKLGIVREKKRTSPTT